MNQQRGSAPVELALLTPMVIVLLLFVVFVGRIVTTQQDLDAAARDAARAASLRATPDAAVRDADAAFAAALASHDLSCATPDVAIDTSRFRPGGAVRVTVTCDVSFADISRLGVPGTRRLTAHSTAVIDTYRSDAP
jgi:Flp pilus assembly protein TadG